MTSILLIGIGFQILVSDRINVNSATAATQRIINEVQKTIKKEDKKEEIVVKEDENAAKKPKVAHTNFSSSRAAPSFTSTALSVVTKNESDLVTPAAVREQKYRDMKKKAGKPEAKGYVRLKTTLGNINLQLDCEYAPRTCHSFMELCSRGYYNGVSFHRLIKGFMIQGGDPTGTGRGKLNVSIFVHV